MKGIKKHTTELVDYAMRDFINEKGLEDEYHIFLGRIWSRLAKGQISFEQYKQNVIDKIL